MNSLIARAVNDLAPARQAVALTGAGISIDSGIPPFRGKGGLWERFDPMEIAHIDSFLRNPGMVWKVLVKDLKDIIDRARPNDGHKGLARLEQLGILMANLELGIALSPYIGRMARAAVVETLQEPFVAFARAKGLKRANILSRYVLRHAITSIVVVLGLDIGYLLSGQIIVEELFNWPGAGRVIVRSILVRDYFMVQATILIYAGLFLLINFTVELLHAWLDPRVQLK